MDWFDRLPKIELHVHMEGAIPHHALWDLICKYGGDPAVPDMDALQQRFVFRDFPHFLQMWSWKNRFLREYEDFTHIAQAVAADLSHQNIRYAEMFFSPSLFVRKGLKPQMLTSAVRAGFSRVPDIQIALIADFARGYDPRHELAVLEELNEVKEHGVVGIGLGGSEDEVPPELFAAVFARSRELGFRTTAHAGEAAGPGSIWGALRALQVERIGHGVRAGEDQALLDFLADRHIPLEMCPLSNLRTKVVASADKLPVQQYFDRGLLITINTDDPAMFGNSLAQEFRMLHDTLGFSADEIRQLLLNAVEASWLTDAAKAQLKLAMTQDSSWAENPDVADSPKQDGSSQAQSADIKCSTGFLLPDASHGS